MSIYVSDKSNQKTKRPLTQKSLIGVGLVITALLIAGSIRLNSFEDAVKSIVRIEVPVGVLADLEPISKVDLTKSASIKKAHIDNAEETLDPFTPHPAGPARNFLLVGTDSAVGLDPADPAANRDRSAGIGLADTIMIVRLDPALATASVMSLPRDLYVTIYREGVPIRAEKLASSLLVGGLEKGAPTLVETITNNFDIPIHNFGIVDFFGFEKLVDELSGVPLWFPYPVRDLASGLMVTEAGCSVLNGQSSLAFVRSRKMEAFVDGRWSRVGVWNDLERNQRQQDFLIRTIQRAISKGARSVLIRDSLIRAGAETVVLDDRLTISELLKLGQSFADFEPNSLSRILLPVIDAVAGTSEILKLGEGASGVFGIFRGESVMPDGFSFTAIDSRDSVESEDDIFDELRQKGFLIESQSADIEELSKIYFSAESYQEAVLLGRYIEPVPKFEFNQKLGKEVILVLGRNFEAFPLLTKSFEEVDREARSVLPIKEDSLTEDAQTLIKNYSTKTAIPVRQGEVSPMQLVEQINGQPPADQQCE